MEAVLRNLEESLWRAETRFDRQYMDKVLAHDFLEFGRSGRRYDRAAILALAGESLNARLTELSATLVSPDVALVTYISEVTSEGVQRANRSSLWVHDGNAWRLRFHQGTPIEMA